MSAALGANRQVTLSHAGALLHAGEPHSKLALGPGQLETDSVVFNAEQDLVVDSDERDAG